MEPSCTEESQRRNATSQLFRHTLQMWKLWFHMQDGKEKKIHSCKDNNIKSHLTDTVFNVYTLLETEFVV